MAELSPPSFTAATTTPKGQDLSQTTGSRQTWPLWTSYYNNNRSCSFITHRTMICHWQIFSFSSELLSCATVTWPEITLWSLHQHHYVVATHTQTHTNPSNQVFFFFFRSRHSCPPACEASLYINRHRDTHTSCGFWGASFLPHHRFQIIGTHMN